MENINKFKWETETGKTIIPETLCLLTVVNQSPYLTPCPKEKMFYKQNRSPLTFGTYFLKKKNIKPSISAYGLLKNIKCSDFLISEKIYTLTPWERQSWVCS